jgi:hypothetical protein
MGEAEQQASSPAAPADANALRGFHFRRLMRKPLALILIGADVLAAGIVAGILVGPLIGLAAAAAVLVVGLLIVLVIADSRAADAFYASYATEHGLALGGRAPLPGATPLLRRGDDRYAERTFSGALDDGVEGTLALYTYEEESTDSEGNRETNYYHYTVGLVEVAECADHVPELFCRHKSGLRSLEKVEDVFRRDKERVHLESEALDEKYEIFAGKGQDAVWLRQLFSPTFIVWLGEEAPKKFAFELVDGNLCCYVNGHKQKGAELDGMRLATGAVARRLREESRE